MTTAALITKLKKKLEKETDKEILRSIEILLREDTKEAIQKRRLVQVAVLSNEAIARGEVMSLAQAKAKLDRSIKKRRTERNAKAKRA
ncbi:MAG: hypothetical protein IPK99_08050 [Flavobacteriales bacterium]|nr:hypothetical protein [Flavobacteriales bacterium]